MKQDKFYTSNLSYIRAPTMEAAILSAEAVRREFGVSDFLLQYNKGWGWTIAYSSDKKKKTESWWRRFFK